MNLFHLKNKHYTHLYVAILLIVGFFGTLIFVSQSNKQQELRSNAAGTLTVAKDGSAQYTTIQSALNVANAGDTVIVKPGTYNETVTFTKSGSSGSYITLQGESGAIIDGTGKTSRGLVTYDGRSYIKLIGLKITNASGHGVYGGGGISNIVIKDNEVVNAKDGGIFAGDGSNVVIDGNTVTNVNNGASGGNIDNAANEGITLYKITTFEIMNNSVYGNHEEGIDVKNGTINGSVHNNLVYSNNGPNIYADGANNVKMYNNTVYDAKGSTKAGIVCAVESGGNSKDLFIYNNVVYGNAGGGIDCWMGHYSNVQVYNNTIYNNKRGSILASNGVVTNSIARNNIIFNNVNNNSIGSGFTADHNLMTDPNFVNAADGDFHLKTGSSAINAGISDGAPETDFDGVARPVGGSVDIGAFEYGGSAPSPSQSVTQIPSTSPDEDNMQVTLTLFLHGLGKAGDNANAVSQINPDPQRLDRTVSVQVFNAQNVLVATKSGTVTYASGSGTFVGTIDLGSLSAGNYSLKVKTDQFLRALIPGIQALKVGEENKLPETVLTTGDINNDNFMNILDYNILEGCFSDLLPAQDCTDANKVRADLTDDGKVNQYDYNLFVREISTQPGN